MAAFKTGVNYLQLEDWMIKTDAASIQRLSKAQLIQRFKANYLPWQGKMTEELRYIWKEFKDQDEIWLLTKGKKQLLSGGFVRSKDATDKNQNGHVCKLVLNYMDEAKTLKVMESELWNGKIFKFTLNQNGKCFGEVQIRWIRGLDLSHTYPINVDAVHDVQDLDIIDGIRWKLQYLDGGRNMKESGIMKVYNKFIYAPDTDSFAEFFWDLDNDDDGSREVQLTFNVTIIDANVKNNNRYTLKSDAFKKEKKKDSKK